MGGPERAAGENLAAMVRRRSGAAGGEATGCKEPNSRFNAPLTDYHVKGI